MLLGPLKVPPYFIFIMIISPSLCVVICFSYIEKADVENKDQIKQWTELLCLKKMKQTAEEVHLNGFLTDTLL